MICDKPSFFTRETRRSLQSKVGCSSVGQAMKIHGGFSAESGHGQLFVRRAKQVGRQWSDRVTEVPSESAMKQADNWGLCRA